MEVHKQYNLRSRKVLDTPKKPVETPAKKNVEILTQKNLDVIIPKKPDTASKTIQTNDPSTNQPRYIPQRDGADKLEAINSNKTQTSFNIENELAKLKIPIPFTELMSIPELHEINEEKQETDILQLKDNILPRGLVPLEDLFDFNDVAKKPKIEPTGAGVEEHNIGIELQPKMIKLSRTLPPTEKLNYIKLFKEYIDVFAWRYEDLKSYDTSIIQHKIPLKENHKPFKQELRKINTILMPLVEKEVKGMYDAKIIVPLKYSKLVSNLVPTRKKTSEIRLCTNFRNLNKASVKDNYPLPKMDHILQKVVGSSRISLLDGFSGYNQVLVHPDDQEKTTFTTP
eukprot:PITA_04133